MKFKYYITDLYSGTIQGTNDESVARELANCEDYFVVNAETGNWLVPINEAKEVEQFKYGK